MLGEHYRLRLCVVFKLRMLHLNSYYSGVICIYAVGLCFCFLLDVFVCGLISKYFQRFNHLLNDGVPNCAQMIGNDAWPLNTPGRAGRVARSIEGDALDA